MKIEDRLLTHNSYSRPGTPLQRVTKIVIHYVGNAKSTAIANRNYFESLKDKKDTYASSHYIIGLEGEIVRCVPDYEVAYHGNDSNSYAIGIENCHPDWSGKFNDKTYKSLVELCVALCKQYKLDPLTDIIRHYDVTKKSCPLYWVDHPNAFIEFRKEVKAAMTEVDMEYKKAVDKLVEVGIIGSPAAWYPAENIKLGNVPALIKKTAKKL